MLVGSIIPTAGNVRLDMMDLRNWDPRQFGESVGYLPQDVQLFPASIKANIARMREDATRRGRLRRGRDGRRARDDLELRAGLRDHRRHGRQPPVGRPAAADRAGPRVLRQSAPDRARRAEFEPRLQRRARARQVAAARQGKADHRGNDHPARRAARERRQDHDPASGLGAGFRQPRRDHSDDCRAQAEQQHPDRTERSYSVD